MITGLRYSFSKTVSKEPRSVLTEAMNITI